MTARMAVTHRFWFTSRSAGKWRLKTKVLPERRVFMVPTCIRPARRKVNKSANSGLGTRSYPEQNSFDSSNSFLFLDRTALLTRSAPSSKNPINGSSTPHTGERR